MGLLLGRHVLARYLVFLYFVNRRLRVVGLDIDPVISSNVVI